MGEDEFVPALSVASKQEAQDDFVPALSTLKKKDQTFSTPSPFLQKDGGQESQVSAYQPESVQSQLPSEATISGSTHSTSGGLKDFEKRIQNPVQAIDNGDGSFSTHLMANTDNIAFPTIVNINGKLKKFEDVDEARNYALKTGEYKEFKTDKEAQDYAEGAYKKGTPLENYESPQKYQSDLALKSQIKAKSQELIKGKTAEQFANNPLFQESNPNYEKNREIFLNKTGQSTPVKSQLEGQWGVLQPIADLPNKYAEATKDVFLEGNKQLNEAVSEVPEKVGDLSTKGLDADLAHPILKGALGVVTATASPVIAAFNLATEGIAKTAEKTLPEKHAKIVGEAIPYTFSLAHKAAASLGYTPEVDTNGDILLSFVDFIIGGKVLEVGGKSIKNVKELQAVTEKAAKGELTPSEQVEYESGVEKLKTATMQDAKVGAEKINTPQAKEVVEKINKLEEDAKPKENELHPESVAHIDKISKVHDDLVNSKAETTEQQQLKEELIKSSQENLDATEKIHSEAHALSVEDRALKAVEINQIDSEITPIEEYIKNNAGSEAAKEAEKKLQPLLERKKQLTPNESTNENIDQTEASDNSEGVSGNEPNAENVAGENEPNAEGQKLQLEETGLTGDEKSELDRLELKKDNNKATKNDFLRLTELKTKEATNDNNTTTESASDSKDVRNAIPTKVKSLRAKPKGNTTPKHKRPLTEKGHAAIKAFENSNSISIRDRVLAYFVNKGTINISALNDMFGKSKEEHKTRLDYWNNKRGLSINGLADKLAEEDYTEESEQGFNSKDYKSAVEEVINDHANTRTMEDELINKYDKNKAEQEFTPEEVEYYTELDKLQEEERKQFNDESESNWNGLTEKQKESLVNDYEGNIDEIMPEENPEKTAGQIKAEKEYDAGLTEIEEKLSDAKISKQNKINSINKKSDLFEGKGKFNRQKSLLDVEQDQSQNHLNKLLKPFNDIITNLEKEKQAFTDNKDKFLSKYDNQVEISLADKIRTGKIDGTMSSIPLFKQAWNTSVEIVARAIEAGEDVAKAIERAVKSFKESEYYKSLSNKNKVDWENDLRESLEDLKPKEEVPKGITAAKNTVLDAKLKEIGLEPIFKELHKTDEQMFKEVAELLTHEGEVERIVNDAVKNTRYTLTAVEQLAVLREHDVLFDKYNELSSKINNGKFTEADILNREGLKEKLKDYSQVIKNAGTVSGQVLRARQFFINKELTVKNILNIMRADSKGKPIPEDLVKMVEIAVKERDEAVKQLKEQEQKVEDLKLELANKVAKGMEKPNRHDVEVEVERRKKNQEPKSRVKNLVEVLKEKQRKRGNIINDQKLSPELLDDADLIKEIGKEILFDSVAENRDITAEQWSSEVHKAVKEAYPELTEREVKTVLSGYGKEIKPSEDPALKLGRKLKTILRLSLGLEDVQGGHLPQKSGLAKESPSPEQRILRKEIAKAIKEQGLDTDHSNDPSKWKSAIESVKTGLRNKIDLLNEEIKSGKRLNTERSPLALDAETLFLKQERERLKTILNETLEGNGTLDAERLSANKKHAENKIAELQDAIDNEKVLRKERKGKILDTELNDLEKTKKDLKDKYDEWYSEKYKDDIAFKKLNSQIESVKKRIEKKEAAIEKVRKDKDYSDLLVKKKLVKDYDKFSDKVKAEKKILDEKKSAEQKINDTIHELREQHRIENMSSWQKIVDGFDKVTKSFVISRLTALAKITESGIAGNLIEPIRSAFGLTADIMMSKEAKEKLSIEKGGNPIEDIKALKNYNPKKWFAEAKKKFQTQRLTNDEKFSEYANSQNEKVYITIKGKKYNINPTFIGASHGFAKTPSYIVAYERTLSRLMKDAEKNPDNFDKSTGLIKDDVERDLQRQAHNQGYFQVLLAPNFIAKSIKGFVEEKGRSKKWAVKNILYPILKLNTQVMTVATNFAGQQLSYVPGLGQLAALIRHIETKGNMLPEDANFIKRNIKSGNIGIALFAMGYSLLSDNFDDKGHLTIDGEEVPHWMTHIPPIFIMKMGAILKHHEEEDSEDEVAAKTFKAISHEFIAANPFYYNAKDWQNASDNKDAAKKLLYNQTLGRAIPQMQKEIVGWLDDEKRAPEGWSDYIKMDTGIYRQTVE